MSLFPAHGAATGAWLHAAGEPPRAICNARRCGPWRRRGGEAEDGPNGPAGPARGA
jgi:hypothetical protein